MNKLSKEQGRTLAEIMLLQRWAGGETVSAARMFGLLHGFETVLQEESCKGISEDLQEKVEDILQAVDDGTLSPDGPSIKSRLRQDNIDEHDAGLVMQLCQLQSRFPDVVDQMINAKGSIFGHLPTHGIESHWTGALHYVELVDTTDGAHKKLHAVFSPCVPRVGETIEPEAGSFMRVVEVNHVLTNLSDSAGEKRGVLVPYVILEAIGD